MPTRYLFLWLVLPMIGMLNGTIRQLVYTQFLGELPAHQLSTLTGMLFMGGFIWFITKRWPLSSLRQAGWVGGIWLLLTIGFEFGLGHYGLKVPWSVLLHDYNLLAGRTWVLLLIWIAVAPAVFYRIHLKKNAAGTRL